MTDEICIVNSIDTTYTNPEEHGETVASISTGTYVFQQLPFPPADGVGLLPLLNRFAITLSSTEHPKNTVFVRLYKEGPLSIAVQFLAPINRTRAE